MLKKKIAYFCMSLVFVLLCACSGDADELILIGSEDVLSTEETVSGVLGKNRRGVVSEGNKGSGETNDGSTEIQVMIRVYVCGAVLLPGVVEVPEGSRVEDVLEAAGGFTEEADRTYVNLAAWITDGKMIYFPTVEEVSSGQLRTSQGQGLSTGAQVSAAAVSTLVNINTADEALLCTLPGIGESRAADIIAYRQEHGFFQSCEDIMAVPGIKTGVYEKICDKITVDERLGP